MTSPSGFRLSPGSPELRLFDGEGGPKGSLSPAGPPRFLKPCDTPGPYHRRVWTDKSCFWQVLYCNRPVMHSGDHSWSPPGKGPAHLWGTDGLPRHSPTTPEVA